MLHTRILGRDVESGLVTVWHYDPDADAMTIEHRVDTMPLIDRNVALQNDARSDWKGDLHFVGSIDPVTHMKLIASGCMNDQKCLSKWLNDRDNRKFRVKLGKL